MIKIFIREEISIDMKNRFMWHKSESEEPVRKELSDQERNDESLHKLVLVVDKSGNRM